MQTATPRNPESPDTDAELGQGMAEYALILSLVAVTAIVALVFIGTAISTTLTSIGRAL
ncbi:MAG: hypothetical protein WCK58_09500 [Chloroflexota bacterium]